MKKKAIVTFILFFCFSLISVKSVWAIGEFSVGVTTGLSYDTNSLQSYLQNYQYAMATVAEKNADYKYTDFNKPYAGGFGINLRYQFNYFLFKVGFNYFTNFKALKGELSLVNNSQKNVIEFKSKNWSVPVSVALLVPLKKHTYLYFGGGCGYYLTDVQISQTTPLLTKALIETELNDGVEVSFNKKDSYQTNHFGIHFLFGAEAAIYKQLTLSVEWLHQEGFSSPTENNALDSDGNAYKTPIKMLDITGDLFLLSINYYIEF